MENEKVQYIYTKKGDVNVMEGDLDISKELKPGFYELKEIRGPFGMSITRLRTSSKFQIPNSANAMLQELVDIDMVTNFFNKRTIDFYNSLEMNHSIGIMFHGIQGSAKTTSINALCNTLQDTYNGVVFTIYGTNGMGYLLDQVFPHLEKTNPGIMKIILFDECEEDLRQDESEWKRILDGNNSSNNILFLFSTNYLARVPKTIWDRPSRIKYCIETTGIKQEDIIFNIIKSMNEKIPEESQLDEALMRDIVPGLKGKTIDHIKDSFLNALFSYNKVIKI